MSEGTKIYVGADVSKDELVIAHPSAGQWVKSKVANTLLDIEAWVKGLGNEDKHFILEATGSYSHRLVHVLGRLGHKFSVVNPGQSRAMAQVLAKTNKNDEQDAHTLSLLGSSLKLRPHKMPDETQKKRTEAFSALTSLQKQEKQLLNQLHAFEYRVEPSAVATKALNNVLESVQQAIAELEKELADDAAHECHRQEHRNNGEGRGHHREADFGRGLQRGLRVAFAHRHVAHDVFAHHDGVVDQDADRQ